jgi:hypothetical protein
MRRINREEASDHDNYLALAEGALICFVDPDACFAPDRPHRMQGG